METYLFAINARETRREKFLAGQIMLLFRRGWLPSMDPEGEQKTIQLKALRGDGFALATLRYYRASPGGYDKDIRTDVLVPLTDEMHYDLAWDEAHAMERQRESERQERLADEEAAQRWRENWRKTVAELKAAMTVK